MTSLYTIASCLGAAIIPFGIGFLMTNLGFISLLIVIIIIQLILLSLFWLIRYVGNEKINKQIIIDSTDDTWFLHSNSIKKIK